jgi:hypothetical protein
LYLFKTFAGITEVYLITVFRKFYVVVVGRTGSEVLTVISIVIANVNLINFIRKTGVNVYSLMIILHDQNISEIKIVMVNHLTL